jgi:hypothetical protein
MAWSKLFDSHSDPVARDAQGRPPPVDKYGAPLTHDEQGRPLGFYRPRPPGRGKYTQKGRGMGSYTPQPPGRKRKTN